MATQPIIHIYKEINQGKYKSTKHFELLNVNYGTTQLSESINISKNQNCAQSMPEFWLKIRQGKKWSKNYLTGLFKTNVKNVFKGDHNKKQHLIIFKFSEDTDTLIVYYFKDYYTNDLSKVLPLIETL